MRRLLTFACAGETLAASLDPADGGTGVLMVTGGSQARIGSHRMYERLARSLSVNGFPVFRFDRRGVGDSSGADPGYRGSAPDIAAAMAAFRREQSGLARIIGFGLCDGGTALALHTRTLDGIVLVNPWLVEAEADAPPPAAIRRHYRDRLTSLQGWKALLSGGISYRKLGGGIAKLARRGESGLAGEVATGLRLGPPTRLILARGDATAIAAEAEWRSEVFAAVASTPFVIDSDSHTFAKTGDAEALLRAVLEVLAQLTRSP